MTAHSNNGKAPPQVPLHFELDDEQYEALVQSVAGEKVVGLVLWEESIADDLDNPLAQPPAHSASNREGAQQSSKERVVFDLDLYLENNSYLALYGATLFLDPESDPLRGWQRTGKMLQSLTTEGVWLEEIAATEEDELVLVLSRDHTPRLFLTVSGWTVEEWETLPDEQ